jgi:acid phosphatase type 7
MRRHPGRPKDLTLRAGIAAAIFMLLLLALDAVPAAAAEPRAVLTPASGLPGTTFSLRGSNFPARRRVVVRIGRRIIATPRSSAKGSWSASATIPEEAGGRVRITSSSRSRRVVSNFQVSTKTQFFEAREIALRSSSRLRSTPYRSSAGSHVRLVGSNFPGKRRVKLRFGKQGLGSVRTSRSGSFTKKFPVPSLPQGAYTITARGGGRSLRLTFTVTIDPLVAAAGDIACDLEDPRYNGGLGTPGACHQKQTSDVILGLAPDAVFALGDTQYEAGTPVDFRGSYEPTWGRFKSITRPAIGNHEYGHQNGAGYFDYFGALAGPRPHGYYSFDLGAWHVVVLNTNCSKPAVTCGPGSAQEKWLRDDLAAHPNRCALAVMHNPLFSSGQEGPEPSTQAFYDTLYRAGAEVVLSGDNHDYERFAPQTPSGIVDPGRGLRQFVVGTGGRDLQTFKKLIAANTESLNDATFGVLALRLRPSSYEWRFVPETGGAFTDTGSYPCH